MELVVVWLILSFLAGWIAAQKGRSGTGFFLLALFLSPLIGILAAAFASRNDATLAKQALRKGIMVKCPACAELIKREATICRFCNQPIEVSPEPESASFRVARAIGRIIR